MKNKILLLGLCILSILVLTSCRHSVCGNGIAEAGEDSSTCCADTGCSGTFQCINNTCIEPDCGDCGYFDNETMECKDYVCCTNDDCAADKECKNHECKILSCGSCQSIDNHQCKDLTCCDDDDCDDRDASTIDLCKFPSTKSSECSHEALETCDTNSDCNDNTASTEDICVDGDPNECIHITIRTCKDNDGYCPDDCDYTDDNDCESDIEDCGTRTSCFQDALDDCTLAKVSLKMDVDDDDLKRDITILMEITGYDDDEETCAVDFEFDDIDVEFTSEYRAELIAGGDTEDDVDDREENENDDYDDYEGDSGDCNFADDDIDGAKAVLEDWIDDDFDVDDFNSYDCDGNFFDYNG